MAESAPNIKSDALKRRSTRIVQAVPLTVTGVDALGRPFEERTSTSIISCHGCRYQSKHYVLKNMWVTLEVPHPEQGRPPRSTRARVMWIQRPRTVRELFQVGVELEVPGNLWGIAFGPPDWFPFPDSGLESSANALGAPHQDAVPETESWSDAPEDAPAEDNIRTMPFTSSTGGVEPLTLARQMTLLVNDAKLQLRTAIHDQAAEAVSTEARTLLASLQDQLREAAERSVALAAANASEHTITSAAEQAEARVEARLREVVDRYNDELARSLEQHYQKLIARSDEIEPQRRDAFEQQLQARVEQALSQLQAATRDSQATIERAREDLEISRRQAEESASATVREGTSRLQAQADDARARVSELENVLQRFISEIEPTSASAQADFRDRLEADTTSAARRWNDRLEGSLGVAAQRVEERLAGTAQATGEQFDNDLRERVARLNNEVTEATADAENRLGVVRSSFESEASRAQALLTQIQLAAQSVADQTAQLDALRAGAQLELERRAAALVEMQSQELARRGEDAIAAWTERLQPALEAAGQEASARVGAQLEQQLSSHLDRANQMLARLESESLAAEEARLKHEEFLTALSGRTIEAATAQLQKQVDLLGHDFQEAGRNTVSQWFAEIDAKATETTHSTFESLFKTADWYEKKVQAQMQATLEKGVEQGVEQLREKAGEISRLFAGELDHYSRSYVEHTRGQIDETAREALERARKQSTEMIASSVSSLAQQMQAGTDAAMGDFQGKAEATLGNLAAHVEDQVAQTQARIEAVSAHLSTDFGASIAQQAEQMLASARQQLIVHVDSARNTLRMESDARERHLLEELASVSDRGIEAYKERLEGTSSSWLLTTVSRLNQNSEQHLETLSRTAESRLNDICKQVFAGVGESLRRQMLDLTVPAPTVNSTEAPSQSDEHSEPSDFPFPPEPPIESA